MSLTSDRYVAEQIVSAFVAEASVPSEDFAISLEGDRARTVLSWLEDEIEDTLKSRTRRIERLQKLAVHSGKEGTQFYYKDAWEADQEYIKKLKNALSAALPELKSYYNDIGGCDHDVNICCCSLRSTIWLVADALK